MATTEGPLKVKKKKRERNIYIYIFINEKYIIKYSFCAECRDSFIPNEGLFGDKRKMYILPQDKIQRARVS